MQNFLRDLSTNDASSLQNKLSSKPYASKRRENARYMNPAYQKIIAASVDDQRGLFVAAANRVGTTIQNIEKDFWVCWTLDALYHRLKEGGPRLLFKGGTSLSKAYALISQFSEDIDITVFREDIGEAASFEELENLSRHQAQRTSRRY